MKSDGVYYGRYKQILSNTALFAGLSNNLLDDMLSTFRRDTWRQDTQLSPEAFRKRFYLLIIGRLEVMRVNPDTGRSLTLFLLGPGDGIDIVTLLNGRPHEVSPSALDDVELVSAPIPNVRSWIDRHPEFNRNFLPYLGEQMRKMEDLATNLVLHDTMTRLARLILRHVVPEHPSSNDGEHHLKLIHDLCDESLARMVGSVRQVVNKHLQHWRKQGILHKGRFHTEITDLKALQAYSDDAMSHIKKRAGRQR